MSSTICVKRKWHNYWGKTISFKEATWDNAGCIPFGTAQVPTDADVEQIFEGDDDTQRKPSR